MKPKITKAILAAAGYGTRFLPATKNQPKQMLPIIDKPIIHYCVEEAVASGITDIILVTQAGQGALEDYFDSHYELEKQLEESGKIERLNIVKSIPEMANFIYVRQKKSLPYGNATPLLAAKSLIDPDEGFVYYFADDLTISSGETVTKQLINVFQEQNASAVLAVQEVADSEVHKYGTVRYKTDAEYKYEISEILEKMPLGKNPSNTAQYGRFVFSYDIIKEAEKLQTGKDNELWIPDLLDRMAKNDKKVIAYPPQGEWITTGDPLSYLMTTFKFAMQREDLKDELIPFLREQLCV